MNEGETQGQHSDLEADDIEEPVILEPAFRHGVAEGDMLHALRFELHQVVQEDAW